MEELSQRLTYRIRGAIYDVHKLLGPGLYEECYHQALLYELKLRGLNVKSKVKIPVIYKGIEIKEPYEIDLLVDDKIIIELKSVEELSRLHFKQVSNYLHLSNLYIGFLVNFNSIYLTDKDFVKIYNSSATNKEEL